jgi:L-arabinose isomerase
MIDLKKLEVWFVTGSQHLYGPETLKQVAENSQTIAAALSKDAKVPVSVVFKPVLTTAADIRTLCQQANVTENCIGLITWMHTFSPAKMWIAGLKNLSKPFLHLHTQFNRDIPFDSIDMDFMNLNQAAHGDREFGFMGTRLRLDRKVVVGHWQDAEVVDRIAVWTRAAAAWNDWQTMKVARFGDNMRDVAVTEGDKVAAQVQFGYQVHGFGIGDLVAVVNQVTEAEIAKTVEEYKVVYQISDADLKSAAFLESAKEQAKIEIGLRRFLENGKFGAFTTTFEDLHGLKQLPGLAAQRLMAEGYGFGAEGDWKTAALVRAMKVMSHGLETGASFMEDYTYHLDPTGQKVLGAHMLEVCPTISSSKPKLEVHALGIGGKDAPARLVFDVASGAGLNASIMDMGNRFRLLVNTVKVAEPVKLPKLPVACVLWEPMPNLKVGAAAWIYAGGAHHTGFSKSITAEYLEDFAAMAGIEYVLIGEDTCISDFKKELKWNDLYYMMSAGMRF